MYFVKIVTYFVYKSVYKCIKITDVASRLGKKKIMAVPWRQIAMILVNPSQAISPLAAIDLLTFWPASFSPVSRLQTFHLELQMLLPSCWPAPTVTEATSVWHLWRSTSSIAMRRTRRTFLALSVTTRLLTGPSSSGIWWRTSRGQIRCGGDLF